MGKALYRKYRPKCLSDVIGEEQVTNTLDKALKSNKISHAYLFIGPRGCGKTSVARIFAHEINSFKYELEDDYVDIIEIDAASNTGVDNIRELREKASIAPTKGKYKIYIIDEVHMLSKSAFNALLKTLEEPPKHVIFIMATTDAYKVPITISSRSQVYHFKLAEPNVMFNFLKDICQKENIKIDDDAIKLIVKRGGGSFRDSLSLLDQISTLSDLQITKQLVIDCLGIPEDDLIKQILEHYSNVEFSDITIILKNLLNMNVKADIIIEELINKIFENPKPEFIPLLHKLSEIKAPFMDAKLLVALLDNQMVATPTQRPIEPIQKVPQVPQKPQETQPKQIPTPVPQPQSTVQLSKDFLQNVQKIDSAIYQQVLKATIIEDDKIIHIFPKNKTLFRILTKDSHKSILIDAANGKKIEIHAADESPETKKDPTISKISDIMGGAEEVKTNGGEVPF